jgi:GNAT superfamily N-acetyltransferase
VSEGYCEGTPVFIRRAQFDDVDDVIKLMGEHARHEQSTPPRANADSLRRLLFAPDAPIKCWVAVEAASVVARVVGYATTTIDWSTWHCEPFIYLDTLFVHEHYRSNGVGAMLLDAVITHAHDAGIATIEWQTPIWNTDAARFYQRRGAVAHEKYRFVLDLNVAPMRVHGRAE